MRMGLWLIPVSVFVADFTASPAVAMNQEGHDGFMKDFPPGIEAFGPGPGQFPLPSPPCPVTADMAKTNPYEQIPLERHGCDSIATGIVTTLPPFRASLDEVQPLEAALRDRNSVAAPLADFIPRLLQLKILPLTEMPKLNE